MVAFPVCVCGALIGGGKTQCQIGPVVNPGPYAEKSSSRFGLGGWWISVSCVGGRKHPVPHREGRKDPPLRGKTSVSICVRWIWVGCVGGGKTQGQNGPVVNPGPYASNLSRGWVWGWLDSWWVVSGGGNTQGHTGGAVKTLPYAVKIGIYAWRDLDF